MYKDVELIVDMKAALGEGPCWDAENQLLYWLDIVGKKVHIYNPQDNSNRTLDVPESIGALVLQKDGSAVVASETGFNFLDLNTGALTPIADPESKVTGNRFNDGKCDPAGRFWAGTMAKSGNTGAFYCLDTNQEVRKAFGEVNTSNGLGWSPDGKTMYYIDSPTKQVAAFDYDMETGTLSNKRVAVTIPEGQGVPDGMTVDEEGMLWVAQWGGYRVSHWNPATGELLDYIPVPAACTSSCAFGGPNMDELYITSARVGVKEADLADQPHAGGLFRVKVGVKGAPSYRFGK